MFGLLYNLLFPIVFLFFLPGLLLKLIRRPGEKRNYAERFGIFRKKRRAELSARQGAIWFHAVSVGETNLALTALNAWLEKKPERRFILSTTTTTAQEIARKKAPAGVEVIFCPIDFPLFVRSTYRLLKPSGLVVFETEIWPNLIGEAKKRGLPTALVNARMSDKSVRGYRRFRLFFAPVLNLFDRICVQTQTDLERFLSVAPALKDRLSVCGNIKFDQKAPANLNIPDLTPWFGAKHGPVIVGASTHKGEEKFIAEVFAELKAEHPGLSLILVPRHAERGGEVAEILKNLKLKYYRKSDGSGEKSAPVDCLLADTTGELMGFLAASDIVIMGKTLAGNDEGQNIIEPAVLAKPIVCGKELKNFRQALAILRKAESIIQVTEPEELKDALGKLADSPDLRRELGSKAKEAVAANSGAIQKNIEILEKLF